MSVSAIANAFPKQRFSTAKKIENDYRWCKDMLDFIILSRIDGWETGNPDPDYVRKLSNYQLYNNIVNQKDFEAECNPYGLNLGDLKDEIKPYNKTYNKINVLLGEELKRPFDYRTALLDQDGIKSKLINQDLIAQDFIDGLMQEVQGLISSHYQAQAQQQAQTAQGQGQEQDPQQAQQMEEALQEKIKTTVDKYLTPDNTEELQNMMYLDAREQLAYKTLEYLTKTMDLVDIKNDGFKHALLAGEEAV